MSQTDPAFQSLKRTRGGRERLLQAATDLFRTHRFAGTSLQMIADRLGVSKAAIYHHFKSRDDIIEALMEPVVVDAETAIARISDLPREEHFRSALDFYAAFTVKHRDIISTVFFDRPALGSVLSGKVDLLVDQLAVLLAYDNTRAEEARAKMMIYGIAAVVAEPRQYALDDDDLLNLVTCLANASQ